MYHERLSYKRNPAMLDCGDRDLDGVDKGLCHTTEQGRYRIK